MKSNLLVTSISKKAPLLKAVKRASQKSGLIERVFGADLNDNCIGKYFVDAFWRMPKIDNLDPGDLITYCHDHNITRIIPTRDGELAFFASHKQILSENEIAVMVSDWEAVNTCLDKLLFFEKINSLGFPVIATTTRIEEITGVLYVVKERHGSGSKSLGLRLTKEQAQSRALSLNEPIFQPYLSGREVSVDLYVDGKGKTKGAVSRLRELVVDGESQITSSIKEDELEMTCSACAEQLHLSGHVIFQALLDEENKYRIIECNPRFGGASTLSIAMGLDSFYWFLLESSGIALESHPFQRASAAKTQIRYAEDLIIDSDSICS